MDKKTQATGNGEVEIRPVADGLSSGASAAGAAASAVTAPLPVSAIVDGARLTNAVLVKPEPALAAIVDQAPPASAPKKDAPLTAGWNGEHFFIRSPDGQFSISPYGYVDNDYRAYKGDGAPSDTFVFAPRSLRLSG